MPLFERILRALRRGQLPPAPEKAAPGEGGAPFDPSSKGARQSSGDPLSEAVSPGQPPQENLAVDGQTLRSLQDAAEREQRTPQEIAGQILEEALRCQQDQDDLWTCWQRLTPREQEIAALICLGYTTRQIASYLHISPETVKTHAERVLIKFQAPDRASLRVILAGWDFSAWDR